MSEKDAEEHRRSATEKDVRTICILYMLNYMISLPSLVLFYFAFSMLTLTFWLVRKRKDVWITSPPWFFVLFLFHFFQHSIT